MTTNHASANGKNPSNNGNLNAALTLASTSKFQFLKPIRFQKTSFWDFGSNIKQQEFVKHKFELIRFSELVKRRKSFFTIDDEKEYKRCKVQLYARGVIRRDTVKGKEIKTKKQQICKTDDFLVAEIDAKVGGYGIVPSELENAIVSSHYYLYEIDKTKLLPEFLGLYLKTDEFARQVQPSGSTNYASIRASQVLEYQIPLPSLKKQEQIVFDYQNKISQAERFKTKAEKLEKEIENYLLQELGIEIRKTEKKIGLQTAFFKDLSRWNIDYILNADNIENFFKGKYKTVRFGNISRGISGGTPSKKVASFWKGEIPWVSPKDMKTDFITKTEDYISESAIENSSTQFLEIGNIIFVMRSGILQHTVPVAINKVPVTINQDLRAFKLLDESADEEYLLRFFQNTQKLLLKLVKTGATVQSIDTKRLEDLNIPIPPLSIQKKIVVHINLLESRIKKLKFDEENLRQQAKDEFESELFEL